MIFSAPIINTASILEFCSLCHEANKKWWIDLETGQPMLSRNKGEMIALMHTEISEAWYASKLRNLDDHLPHRRGFDTEIVDVCIRLGDYTAGHQVSLPPYEMKQGARLLNTQKSDFLLALHDFVSQLMEAERKNNGVPLAIAAIFAHVYQHLSLFPEIDTIWAEKMEYNQQRADHKLANRKAEGGKKL